LQLDNSTGAGISVKDLTTSASATGLGAGANIDESQAAASDAYSPASATTTVDTRIFHGMLKLETTDGSPITIAKGLGQASGTMGSQTELDLLGMNQVNVNDGTFTTYSLQGDTIAAASTNATLANITQSNLTTAFTAGDVIINGVDVFNRDIDTTTMLGKLATINSVSDQTGVTATAQFEQFFDVSSLAGATGRITFTGADGTTTASGALSTTLATTVTNINTAVSSVDSTLTATVDGTGSLKISGDVTELTFSLDSTASGVALMETIFGTDDTDFTTYYGGIQLEAEGSTAITVDLGEDIAYDYGLKAANVGASDFDENQTSISNSTTISGLSIATQTQASAAIASIDAAIQQVTDSSADLGAVENRLNHVIANVSETIVNTEAAKSRIVDADFAVESARLAKQQILQQAASAMLAQANAAPQSVLSLLGG
jgi:flagellin